MINHYCKHPLWEVSRILVDVAAGRKMADTVIRHANLINVCTHEIQPDIDVAIAAGRIAYIGNAEHCIGEKTAIIDAAGSYICPGFMDGHIHVESSMLSVGEYGKAVLPHGTTAIYMDPHEICNVLGLEGVKCMEEDARRTPLKAMIATPSCVPAVPGFEDTGSHIGPDEVRETMTWDSTIGLGEMMNFVGVLAGDENAHGELAETLKSGKIITGHYSMPETDRGLNAYVASGVRCCHESTRAEDALAKMRLGMYAQFREGSAWHDLKEVAKAITEHTVDSRFACLISDDTHPHTLLSAGHLDHIVRRAVQEGIDPITAIQMVTINAAQCYQLDHDMGIIAPGKCADIVFLNNMEDLQVIRTMVDGVVVAENGVCTAPIPAYTYPEWATRSVHFDKPLTTEDFQITVPEALRGKTEVEVRAIEVIPAHVGSYERHIVLKNQDGFVGSDPEQDVLKTVVFERHHNTGKRGKGFVKGFGIRCGAMASTVAHDAHNLLVIGTNDEDMMLAANTLIECGGGMCAVQNGKVLGKVELPIAGLMNDKNCEAMSEDVGALEEAWAAIGCTMPSPFMTMALIPLACLPELRLTDRGLVDCTTFQFSKLFTEE